MDGAAESLKRLAEIDNVSIKNAACHLIELALGLDDVRKKLEAT